MLTIIPVASGIGAGNPGTAQGPAAIQHSIFLKELSASLQWQNPIVPKDTTVTKLAALPCIATLNTELAHCVTQRLLKKEKFLVLGGDHSCAIGTWSAVASHLHAQNQQLGLLWIDAHLDSHTPENSASKNIHGMPLATLLGYGAPELTNIAGAFPKILPQHLCIIGARSFEPEEQNLLQSLGVRIYFMDEVDARGFEVVLAEAVSIVKKNTAGFGVSWDIDGIDPEDAPGVATQAPHGLSGKKWLDLLPILAKDPHCLGYEIVEFNPAWDLQAKTERLIVDSLRILLYNSNY